MLQFYASFELAEPFSFHGNKCNFLCVLVGILGPGTLYKTLSTIIFLYFAVLLPSIALGELNSTNTDGNIGRLSHCWRHLVNVHYIVAPSGDSPLHCSCANFQFVSYLILTPIQAPVSVRVRIMYNNNDI